MSSRNQELTYGTETESFRRDINTKETLITFTSPVIGFYIYAKTVGLRFEIDDVIDDDSMEIPAGVERHRNVFTTFIRVFTLGGNGEVYVTGYR